MKKYLLPTFFLLLFGLSAAPVLAQSSIPECIRLASSVSECITRVVSLNPDLKTCEYPNIPYGARYQCRFTIANLNNDIELCLREDQGDGLKLKYDEACLTPIAISNQDYSYCDQISLGSRDQCVSGVAIALNDKDACRSLVAGFYKDDCLKKIYGALGECEFIEKNSDRDKCWYDAAIEDNETGDDGCDSIEDPATQNSCYYVIARDTRDISLCYKIKSPVRENFCRRVIASADSGGLTGQQPFIPFIALGIGILLAIIVILTEFLFVKSREERWGWIVLLYPPLFILLLVVIDVTRLFDGTTVLADALASLAILSIPLAGVYFLLRRFIYWEKGAILSGIQLALAILLPLGISAIFWLSLFLSSGVISSSSYPVMSDFPSTVSLVAMFVGILLSLLIMFIVVIYELIKRVHKRRLMLAISLFFVFLVELLAPSIILLVMIGLSGS